MQNTSCWGLIQAASDEGGLAKTNQGGAKP